jgi:uncharacterized protein
MATLSRFVHTFDLGEHIALWHSLGMQPVFLDRETYESVLSGCCAEEVNEELRKKKILTTRDDDDQRAISWVRQQMPGPAISLCYFILSERCNLACKYCFLGNNSDRRSLFSSQDMSEETANRAIAFFIKQLELSSTDFTKNKAQLIFFGGEPLINLAMLDHIGVYWI